MTIIQGMQIVPSRYLAIICPLFFPVMLFSCDTAKVLADDAQSYLFKSPDYSSIENKIASYVESNPGASISIALVNGHSIEWLANYPEANNKRIYRAGSLAKVLTALAVMKLQDQELLDIDQPVSAYLPRFSVKRRFSDTRPITLRHLLSHHSGLPTNIFKGQWSRAHFSTVLEQLRNEYVSYPPDFVHAYSNIGYVLLGMVIEEVSRQGYESYIRENIFQPLGMQDSGFRYRIHEHVNFVMPHNRKPEESILPIRDVPAMGLYSTAQDMARLIAMLMNNGKHDGKQVFHPSVIELMMERSNEDVTLDYDHQDGLGLILNHCEFDYHADVIEHGGNTMYYASHFVAVPEYDLGAIVLSNSRSAKKFVHVLARDLVSAALEKHYPDDKKPPVTGANTVSVDTEQSADREFGDARSARYLTKTGLLTLQVDDIDMCACQDEKRLNLLPLPGGWYRIANRKKQASARDIELAPQQIDGQSVLAMRKDGRQQRLGEYVPEYEIPDSWKQRIGHYRVENPDPEFPLQDVSLIERENLLYLGYRMPKLSDKQIAIPLVVLDNDQAITMGLGRGRGETVLAEQTAEGEYLLYSGYRVKKTGG